MPDYGLYPQYAAQPAMSGDLTPLLGGPGLDQVMLASMVQPQALAAPFDFNQLMRVINQMTGSLPQFQQPTNPAAPAPAPAQGAPPIYYIMDPSMFNTPQAAPPPPVVNNNYDYASLDPATRTALVSQALDYASRAAKTDWTLTPNLDWIAPGIYSQTQPSGTWFQTQVLDPIFHPNDPQFVSSTTHEVQVPEQFQPYFATPEDFYRWMQDSVAPYAHPNTRWTSSSIPEGDEIKPYSRVDRRDHSIYNTPGPPTNAYQASGRYGESRRPTPATPPRNPYARPERPKWGSF